MNAGVRVHCPPAPTDKRTNPEQPLPGRAGDRQTWMWTNYVELVVDGDVVDLNRIPLPAGTPLIDQRFKNEQNEAPSRGDSQRAN